MFLIRLTQENVSQYVGYSILFNSRGKTQYSRILGVSDSHKSLRIQYEDLGRSLDINRKIYAVIED